VKLEMGYPYIVPGEKLGYSWSSVCNSPMPIDLGDEVYASLCIVDDNGLLDVANPLRRVLLSQRDAKLVASGRYSQGPYSLQPRARCGTHGPDLCKFGVHTFRLVIQGNGKDPYFESNEAEVLVGPEHDGFWWVYWEWLPSTMQFVEWKTRYYVSGIFHNKARYAKLNCKVYLREKPWAEDWVELGSDQTARPLNPGESATIPFAQIDLSKEWQWFDFDTFELVEDTRHAYQYQARIDAVDQWGNSYAMLTPEDGPVYATPNVCVDVPAYKQEARKTAEALLAVSFVLGGIAGPFYQAALIEYGIAIDPPVPSSAFRSVFPPRPLAVPRDESRKPLIALIEAAFGVIAHAEAICETDNRIVGARTAKAVKSEKLQLRHRRELQAALRALATKLSELTPVAGKFVSAQKELSPDAVDAQTVAWQHDLKVRADWQRKFLDAGGSPEALRSYRKLLARPGIMEVLRRPDMLMMALGRSAECQALAFAATNPPEAEAVRDKHPRRSKP